MDLSATAISTRSWPMSKDLVSQLMKHVQVGSGDSPCWCWVGAMDGNGYGSVRVRGQTCKAHRVAFCAHRRSIPEGMDLDHLCRNRACINPEHLEPVTRRTNTLRGNHQNVVIRRTGICKNGHDMNMTGRYYRRNGRGSQCAECSRERSRLRSQRQRELATPEASPASHAQASGQ